MLNYPIKFPFPNINAFVSQNDKQQGILRKRVGQFDVPWPGSVPSYPEWENRTNAVRLRFKQGPVTELFPVVSQAVNPDFESRIRQPFPQFLWNRIIMGNKIEGGAETKLLFYLHQLQTFLHSALFFHVVSQNKRKLLPVGPSRPAGRRSPGTFVDRPYVPIFFHPHTDVLPSKEQLERPGDPRFQVVIQLVENNDS